MGKGARVRIRFIAVAGIALVATACPAHHASPKAAPSSAALATGTLQDGAPGTYLAIEYNREPAAFCPTTTALGFSSMKKNLNLDAYRIACDPSSPSAPKGLRIVR